MAGNLYFCPKLDFMFAFFKERNRKKFLQSVKRVTEPIFLNLKDIETIGFAIKADTAADFAHLGEILEYLGSLKKGIKGVVVSLKSSGVALPDNVLQITSKQLNWWGGVKDMSMEKYLRGKCDLFISLNPKGDFTLDFITAKSDSKFIVGMTNNPKVPYNFVLEPVGEGISYVDYLKQLFHYLSEINKVSDGE